jgi:hypothetical protein
METITGYINEYKEEISGEILEKKEEISGEFLEKKEKIYGEIKEYSIGQIEYEYKHDFDIYDYLGKAEKGSYETSSTWEIKRIEYLTGGLINEIIKTNVKWSERKIIF